MSRRYSPDHKALILKILNAYKKDVVAASRYTGVPERTLREWRREQRAASLRRRAAVQQRKVPQQQK
jgi:transposase-like protein